MNGAEHAAKAQEYLAFVESTPGGTTLPGGPLGNTIGLALSLGAALFHAVLANAKATVEVAYELDPAPAQAWRDAGAER